MIAQSSQPTAPSREYLISLSEEDFQENQRDSRSPIHVSGPFFRLAKGGS
jgi:hypothetical protein